MPFDFTFPDVGEGIAEGELVKWLVKEGDSVKQDQPLAEVETDKAIVQIPAPRAATILKLHFKQGETVKVGSVFVTLGEQGENPAVASAALTAPAPNTTSVGVVGDLSGETKEFPSPIAAKPVNKAEDIDILATPAIRHIAKELNVDLMHVKGTGPKGRILEEDVRKAAAKPAPAATPTMSPAPAGGHVRKYDEYGYIEHVPFKGIRRATARHVAESAHTATHVTYMEEADVTELVTVRTKEKQFAETKGVKLTYMPFIIKAVIAGLKQYPMLNAMLDEANEEIIYKKYYNIGIATDTPEGLVVPVIKGADKKSMLDIAKDIETLAAAARERKLDMGDMKGGTFTITNVGILGGIYATPIINFPEVAILGIGKIRELPRVVDGKIVARHILPLSLTFDHRVVDGADAARFINHVAQRLEDPELLIVE